MNCDQKTNFFALLILRIAEVQCIFQYIVASCQELCIYLFQKICYNLISLHEELKICISYQYSMLINEFI